jgi:hypothetical protein
MVFFHYICVFLYLFVVIGVSPVQVVYSNYRYAALQIGT